MAIEVASMGSEADGSSGETTLPMAPSVPPPCVGSFHVGGYVTAAAVSMRGVASGPAASATLALLMNVEMEAGRPQMGIFMTTCEEESASMPKTLPASFLLFCFAPPFILGCHIKGCPKYHH